jgi:hypothetical protein
MSSAILCNERPGTVPAISTAESSTPYSWSHERHPTWTLLSPSARRITARQVALEDEFQQPTDRSNGAKQRLVACVALPSGWVTNATVPFRVRSPPNDDGEGVVDGRRDQTVLDRRAARAGSRDDPPRSA